MGIHAFMNSFHSYMHEFPFVHRIHKFDHADDLVIMAMTGCWSFMLVYIIMSSWNISHPHLQGQAAETRAVHVEAEEVQGRAGFRGHGVSTGQPSVVGRWIGLSASRVSSASSVSSTSSATGSSASQDAAKYSCSNLWNLLTAHWPVGQFGDQYFKILQRQNLKVLEKKGPISNLCNNHWIKVTGGAGRSEWIGSEAKVFQFCRRNNSFLVLSQTLRLKEGGDRVIDFSKRSQNRHCLERRWNPIRKGILLTTKSQNWRINKNCTTSFVLLMKYWWQFQPLPPCSNEPTYSFRRRPPEVL